MTKERKQLIVEKAVLADQAPWVLHVQLFIFNAHNLQLLDNIGTHGIIIDALIERPLLGDDLELANSQTEEAGDLDNDLPDLHVGVDDEFCRNIVRVQLHCDFLDTLFIILLYVFKWDMHVVEALDEGFDQSDPVQPHVEIVGILSLGVLIDVELVKLSRDLFDASQEAFDKDLAVLLLDITAQMNINKEVSALNRYFLVLTLNGN